MHRDRVVPGARSDIEVTPARRADADDESIATAGEGRLATSCRIQRRFGRRAPIARYICSPPTVSTIALSSTASIRCWIARSSATIIPGVTSLRPALRDEIDSAFDHIYRDWRARVMLLELRTLFQHHQRYRNTVAFDQRAAMPIVVGPRRLGY